MAQTNHNPDIRASDTVEVNFDGLVAPSHNYAGLAPGNLSSQTNAGAISSPRTAALQGISKMRAVRAMGLTQGVLPPLQRPDLGFLRSLGFGGDDAAVLEGAHREAPDLLACAWSASAMWAANAATVTPSVDADDGRCHLTPANLVSNTHRSLEPPAMTRLLRAIFHDRDRFAVHDPLLPQTRFADEGAANHVRFAPDHGEAGVHLFCFGFDPAHPGRHRPARFRARQSLDASRAIARRHGVDPARTVFAQQHPAAVDAGVFHNDVISTGDGLTFLTHERAFIEQDLVLDGLRRALSPHGLTVITATDADFSLEDAVASYLFNAQLLTTPAGRVLVAPTETRDHPRVGPWVAEMIAAGGANGPIARVEYLDVRESMRNGGGPACLRLRVVLTPDELAGVHDPCLVDDARLDALEALVGEAWPESIAPGELRDHRLVRHCLDALDRLASLLQLPGVSPAQR
ncbi:MAG: N-succinylarginine dihydrolase [Planctomycetota bacterium]